MLNLRPVRKMVSLECQSGTKIVFLVLSSNNVVGVLLLKTIQQRLSY